MQEDMHYYGVYAMARAAGIPIPKAKVIAYASQFVDDSLSKNSDQHDDGGMFDVTATAHTNTDTILNAAVDLLEQRKVWVPFHFFPGAQGDSLSEKLQCVKNSKLVQEMVKNHVKHALDSNYGLALIGIMAHVFADTFSHYGFSGVSSSKNHVIEDSLKFKPVSDEMSAYLTTKYYRFLKKYVNRSIISNWRKIMNTIVGRSVGYLGHAGVGTYPDRPFLQWKFEYKYHEENREQGWRDNRQDFLEACKNIHQVFYQYANEANINTGQGLSFEDIKESVYSILCLEADMAGRINSWKKAIADGKFCHIDENSDEALHYDSEEWEKQKKDFKKLEHSSEIIKCEIYQFHQAAVYHRDYTLKDLLPKHNITVI